MCRRVKFKLNEKLDPMAGGKDLVKYTSNMVPWCDSHRRVLEFNTGAGRQMSISPELIALEEVVTP